MNILFIGNSFTYYNDMPEIFSNLAASAGYDVYADKIAFGGYYLNQYADFESDAGRTVCDKLNSVKWDFVVIQEQSLNPLSDCEDFYKSARILIEKIRSIGAKPVLYQTWAYEKDSDKLKKTGLSYNKMYKGLKKAYEKFSRSECVAVAEAGTAFYKCSLKYPKISLYDAKDNYHPSFMGSYLAACVLFYKLFGCKKKITFTSEIDADTAKKLQKISRRTVAGKNKYKKFFYRISIFVLSAIFIFSVYKVSDYYIQANRSAAEFQRLYKIIGSAQESGHTSASDKYKALKAENPDFVGWISIDGTNINYPVMHTPDRPDYYLRRGFDKKYSYFGTPYVAEDCTVGVSDNIVVYGHNMRNGTMFSALESYLSWDFFKSCRYIEFDTLNDFGTYEILSVFKITENSDFKYYRFIDARNESEFDEFISECKSRSLYDTGVLAHYGDKLITLSTCEYSSKGGRLVVVAKKIN